VLEPAIAPDAAARAGSGPTPRIRDGAPFCVAVFVFVRLLLSTLGVVGVHQHSVDQGVVGAVGTGSEVIATPGWHNAIDGTNRWDATWFTRIAESGYRADDASAVFFPGYPAAIRAVDLLLPIGTLGSALLVSNAAFLGALLVLYALSTLEFSETVARRTVVLLALFPSSIFFLAPYSESLFLLATLLTFWWARRDRWPLSGVAGLIAALSRSVGVALAPGLLIEAVSRRHHQRSVRDRTIWALLPLLGPVVYGAYWLARTGDALRPFHAQASWMRSLQFPLLTIGDAVSLGVRGIGDPHGIYWTGDVVVAALLLLPLAFGWRDLRLGYLAYVGLSLLIPLAYPLPARPFLSMPRFVVVLFPLFWPIARRLERRSTFVAVSCVFLVGFSVLSLAFMNWGFVF
jgi:hypothetical protein